MIDNNSNKSFGRWDRLKSIRSLLTVSRRRSSLGREFILAALPTATVIIVFAFINSISRQQLLFASLAASAFLIYLDPRHTTNTIRTLVIAQISASIIGLLSYSILGSGFYSGGVAMLTTIVLMITLDCVHPPAIATSLSFALRAGKVSNVFLFFLAIVITIVLVILERAAIWLLDYYENKSSR